MRPAPERRTSPPHIDIQVQSPLWNAQPLAEQTIREAITTAAGALSTESGEVSILLTDDSEIARLNRDWSRRFIIRMCWTRNSCCSEW